MGFDLPLYRKYERCSICGRKGFTELEAIQAVITGVGPTQFAHRECYHQGGKRMDEIKDLADHILKAIELYEKHLLENDGAPPDSKTVSKLVSDAADEVTTGFDNRIDQLVSILIVESPESATKWANTILEDYK